MELTPENKNISLSDFAKYVKIKTPNGLRGFTEKELCEINYIEYLKSKGYDLTLVSCRGGKRIALVKRDEIHRSGK